VEDTVATVAAAVTEAFLSLDPGGAGVFDRKRALRALAKAICHGKVPNKVCEKI
jgi:hypothetical protein